MGFPLSFFLLLNQITFFCKLYRRINTIFLLEVKEILLHIYIHDRYQNWGEMKLTQ